MTTVLLREAIGDRLRRTRTEQHRTLREVSRTAKVSLGYLSEVERGRKEASSELLAAICDALDLPLSDLLQDVAGDLSPRLVDIDTGVPLDASDDEEAPRLTDHHELDLAPLLRDAISLAEPIAPLCRPDCPGLCVTCGADLASDPGHAHPDDDIDPRLLALASLRDRLS